jgi:uncharacterized glyoxalase superfamily metalloenzyme YdcJ
MKFLWAFLSHSAAAMFGFLLSGIFAQNPDDDESHSSTRERMQEEALMRSLADEVMDEVELETAMSEEDAAVCERNFA